MLPVGFEPTISAGERPKTYALDRTATGTGIANPCNIYIKMQNIVYYPHSCHILLQDIETLVALVLQSNCLPAVCCSSV